MKINIKIQILVFIAIIAIILTAIGISANNIINEKPQYQKNSWCPYTEDCPQPYCNYQQQSNENYQSRSCCGFRK